MASGPLQTYLAKEVNHVLALPHSAPSPSQGENDALAELSVLTYNVWFDLNDWRLRFDAVADIIKELQPTVVCLQEVTQQFARALKRHPWLSQHYHMLDADDDTVLKTVEPYGVAVLSRFPFERLELHETHSLMQRNALLAEITVNGQKVRVCTAHLESRDFDGFSPPLRKAQLAKVFRLLAGPAPQSEAEGGQAVGGGEEAGLRIITGDFNFPAGTREEESVSGDYTDVWTALHSDEPGHTIGITYPRPRTQPSRYDRILYRALPSASTLAWRVREARTVGAQPIGTKGAGKDIFPSDHLGVFAVLATAPLSS